MLLEPMSIGCPLVTTSVGGIPEVIKNNHNGILVPSQDVDAMVDACKRLLDDPGLASRLGRQAWIDCRDNHGSETVARQTLAAYQEAIDSFDFG
jgi:glycosyltransferase involved in cell wall biosynthesis